MNRSLKVLQLRGVWEKLLEQIFFNSHNVFLAKFQKTPILAKILDENSHEMSKNGPRDMKFSENVPNTPSCTPKTKF